MTMTNSRTIKRKLSLAEDELKGQIVSSPSVTASPDPAPPPPYDSVVANKASLQNILTSPRNPPAGTVTSITTAQLTLTDNNDDMVSAAEALTQLNNGGSPSPKDESHEHPLVTRVNQVSKHPIVTNAVKYYENSKRNYAPFNYAAGIVEMAAIPVVNKIEDNLNSLHKANQKRRKLDNPDANAEATPSTEDDNNLSVETKKRLQFCLHILKLANDHINSKVIFLQQKMNDREREFKEKQIQEEHMQSHSPTDTQDPSCSSETLIDDSSINGQEDINIPSEAAQQTKTEIVTTVKKIIRVISNFKPSSLNISQPEERSDGDNKIQSESPKSRSGSVDLRTTVRDIILNLPASVQKTSSGSQTNDRVVVFAKESLDMIGKLTQVFNEQLERAETWVAGEELARLEEGPKEPVVESKQAL